MIRITHTYNDKGRVFESGRTEVVIGRAKRGGAIDLDLTPDPSVSRPHARIWAESGQVWIEDLGSSYGTMVNDQPLKGKGRRALKESDRVRIGDTFLSQVRFDASESPAHKVVSREAAGAEGVQLQPQGVLEGLQPAQIADLESKGAYLRYEDELVAAEGAELGFFFVVTRGQFAISKVKPETGKPHVIARVSPGQSLGEMSFLMGGPATANVLAVGKTVCWTIQNAKLREFVDSHPGGTRLMLNIALLLARRLQEGDSKLVGASPSLSAFFGYQARAADAKAIGAPNAADHAEMEIPDDVFDQFAHEVLNLPSSQPLTDAHREDVRGRIRENQVDIVPWLDQAGHGRTLSVRLQFVETSPAPRVAVQTPQARRPVLVQVPQTRAQIAPARPVVVRPLRGVWWKIGNIASWVGLPVLAAFVVVLLLPLSARESVAQSAGFRALPGQTLWNWLLFRPQTEKIDVWVKNGTWHTMELEVPNPTRLTATLALDRKPPAAITVTARVMKKGTMAIPVHEQHVKLEKENELYPVLSFQLLPGEYVLECAATSSRFDENISAKLVVQARR